FDAELGLWLRNRITNPIKTLIIISVSRDAAIVRSCTIEEATPVETACLDPASSWIICFEIHTALWCHCFLLIFDIASHSRKVVVLVIAPGQKHDRRIRHAHYSGRQRLGVIRRDVAALNCLTEFKGKANQARILARPACLRFLLLRASLANAKCEYC